MATLPAAPLAVVDEDERVRSLLRGPRIRLLEALRERPDSASGLAGRLGMPRQTINYHLRELERARLVELVEERGHGRCVERVLAPAASTFALAPTALGPLAPHSSDVRDRASAEFLAARAGEVVSDVGRLLAGGERVPTLTLETRIRFASADERAAFARDLQSAIAGLVTRYHDDGAAGGRTFAVLVAAHPEVT
jgi:DNA-binding transcriptional ArsR family regulator